MQTQQPQEVPLRRSTKEKRSAISDDYIVFLQEHQDDIGIMEDVQSTSNKLYKVLTLKSG